MKEWRNDTIGGMHGPWLWPKDDDGLWASRHTVNDLDAALKHVGKWGSVVQAGGGCGIWPRLLSSIFEQVYTFEPCQENFHCLTSNVFPYASNVRAFPCAISGLPGMVSLKQNEGGNSGTWRIDRSTAGKAIPALSIDQLCLKNVGLLALDLEGNELEALKGAVGTIEGSSPIIMLELNGLGDDQAVIDWLKEAGYEICERIHRDCVFRQRNAHF
jgi:FkbM family methyltransferase